VGVPSNVVGILRLPGLLEKTWVAMDIALKAETVRSLLVRPVDVPPAPGDLQAAPSLAYPFFAHVQIVSLASSSRIRSPSRLDSFPAWMGDPSISTERRLTEPDYSKGMG
jgi:hypothetical protein